MTLKERVSLDQWFDRLCNTYAKGSESDRDFIRKYFQAQQQSGALLDYLDTILIRCVPSNATQFLKKSLVLLCIQNQKLDYREFDLRLEKVWKLSIETLGSASGLFTEFVELADSAPPASRNWSTREALKHWQSKS